MSKHKHYPVRIARGAYGIRLQDMRTLTKKVFWARKWMALLEGMRLGARLGKGKQYALSGQVTEMLIDGSHVETTVQGSRPDPYRVTLDFTAANEKQYALIAKRLLDDAMLPSRLLVDDLPIEVEEIFREAKLPFFPVFGVKIADASGAEHYDIRMKCSCPDWAAPCKHTIATLLLLGEHIAKHPSSLLSLRGIELDELLPRLDRPVDLEHAGSGVSATLMEPSPLAKRLGSVPFWRGTDKFVDRLVQIATKARPVLEKAVDGESMDLRYAERRSPYV